MRGLPNSSSGLPIYRTSLTTLEVNQEEEEGVGTDEGVGAGEEGIPEEGEGAAG